MAVMKKMTIYQYLPKIDLKMCITSLILVLILKYLFGLGLPAVLCSIQKFDWFLLCYICFVK